jgi:Family of unknown function (DUF5684)
METKSLKLLKIAFKYSCIYMIFFALKSVYHLVRYKPGINNYVETEISPINIFTYFGIIILFYISLFLSHKAYIQSTPHFKFKDLFVLSLLLVFFTYCLSYVVGVINFYVFYEKFVTPITNTGLLGIYKNFNQPSKPVFSPFSHLIWYPLREIFDFFKELKVWAIVDTVFIAKVGSIFILIYFEALYFLFNKYKQTKAFFVLPVINKWKLIEITQKPKWYFWVLLIPFARLVPLFIINKQIAKDFGRETSFALGLTFLPSIFYGILGLNSDEKPLVSDELDAQIQEEFSIN